MTAREREIANAIIHLHGFLDRIEALLRERADVTELHELGRQLEAATRVETALLARLEVEHAQTFIERDARNEASN